MGNHEWKFYSKIVLPSRNEKVLRKPVGPLLIRFHDVRKASWAEWSNRSSSKLLKRHQLPKIIYTSAVWWCWRCLNAVSIILLRDWNFRWFYLIEKNIHGSFVSDVIDKKWKKLSQEKRCALSQQTECRQSSCNANRWWVYLETFFFDEDVKTRCTRWLWRTFI